MVVRVIVLCVVDVRRRRQLTRWLGSLVWEGGADKYFRYKGVMAVAGSDLKHVLQGVHELFDCQPTSEPWAPAERRRCRAIFIGHRLDRAMLAAGLAGCAAVAAATAAAGAD